MDVDVFGQVNEKKRVRILASSGEEIFVMWNRGDWTFEIQVS